MRLESVVVDDGWNACMDGKVVSGGLALLKRATTEERNMGGI